MGILALVKEAIISSKRFFRFVLVVSILAWREKSENSPQNLPYKQRVYFFVLLGVVEAIFIGSCIGYGFVTQVCFYLCKQ